MALDGRWEGNKCVQERDKCVQCGVEQLGVWHAFDVWVVFERGSFESI